MNVDIHEVPEFYRTYIQQIGNEELVPLLMKSGDALMAVCRDLSEEKLLYRYDEEKWSIKDLIQHLIDAERVFVYRAMRFARRDFKELSGFDQDDYVKEASADHRPTKQLLNEFNLLRASTIEFFHSLSSDKLERRGISNGVEMSVKVIGYIISGHTLHHLQIISERYLK